LYPASHIALRVIRQWLEKNNNRDKVDKIIICTFLQRERECYAKLSSLYFPRKIKISNQTTVVLDQVDASKVATATEKFNIEESKVGDKTELDKEEKKSHL